MKHWQATLGAVIIHYNNFPEICDTVDSVIGQGVAEDRIVIVDNSHSQGLRKWLAVRHPSAVVTDRQGNVGYAAAVNLGASLLRERGIALCLVLTHEVLMQEGTLDQLVEALTEGLAVTAPTIYRKSDPERIWSCGGDLIGDRMYPIARKSWRDDPPAWVDGCCFLMRLDVHESLGGLHEPYFLYLEEVDFFVRMRRSGNKVSVVQTARAYQEPGEMGLYYAVRNHVLLVRRLGSQRAALRLQISHAAKGLVELAVLRSRRRQGLTRLRALRDGCRLDSGPKTNDKSTKAVIG